MPHRVNTAVHAVQAPRYGSCLDRFFAEAQKAQLIHRNHPVLPLRDVGDRMIGCGDFPGHCTG